ncbi:sirohydrochlorin chelatase [Piscinibacter terrae]|uniref:Cobalamin biosynthesis protein CbiX n=1 Tax=Piscinibacter terrae TaxID=2496871 RepID=A0A3N7HN93_9BURK|nr:CbiX/SirB N-terminal domain-containing protein [Albitalea terrae]RQP22141.1 cobalamin biosynthesis protein CbiX [Albitalea terrae]
MKRGLLLFAHGARDSRWALPFEDVVQRIREREPATPVALCFLEFMSPDMVEGGGRLAAQGCTHVDIVPLFLGAGGHVRRDVPELIARLEQAHTGVHWELHPAVGESDAVIDAMAGTALARLHKQP